MTLAQLQNGESRRVISVRNDGRISQRLMEMGLIPGVSVRMVKAAPFGDPIEISVRGYNLALRRAEAETVEVDESPAR